MKLKLVSISPATGEEIEEFYDDLIEIHYNYESPIPEPHTDFEFKTWGFTILNKYIKEFEVKEDEERMIKKDVNLTLSKIIEILEKEYERNREVGFMNEFVLGWETAYLHIMALLKKEVKE